jgi:hypothetical protein
MIRRSKCCHELVMRRPRGGMKLVRWSTRKIFHQHWLHALAVQGIMLRRRPYFRTINDWQNAFCARPRGGDCLVWHTLVMRRPRGGRKVISDVGRFCHGVNGWTTLHDNADGMRQIATTTRRGLKIRRTEWRWTDSRPRRGFWRSEDQNGVGLTADLKEVWRS